ncbi:MAG: glycosyltransferase family 4 protein [Pseudomonadales bacterium]|nr:glycosyltransferase family 4 protein [Pseudomonadales bacterium]
MNSLVVLLGLFGLMSVFVLTHWRIRIALSKKLLDVPNQRSSHSIPTPSSGGMSFVFVLSFLWFCFALVSSEAPLAWTALLLCSGVLAMMGWFDDHKELSAGTRFLIQILIISVFLAQVDALPMLTLGGFTVDSESVLFGGWFLYLLWSVNLYNFMDGIDGMAASQAIYVFWSIAAFTGFSNTVSDSFTVAAVLAGMVMFGFLWFNWAPAKIFMGDIGSAYLGFVLAGFTLLVVSSDAELLVPLILIMGTFIVDATVTLLARLLSGQRFYHAHRSHAYQILSEHWGSHGKVVVAYLVVNLFWLLPFAWLSLMIPNYSFLFLLVAWAPLVIIVVKTGAGKPQA